MGNRETSVVSQNEEKLWENGIINLTTPQGLLYALFFYNGKNVCLQGGQEHKNLKFSQLERKGLKITVGDQTNQDETQTVETALLYGE